MIPRYCTVCWTPELSGADPRRFVPPHVLEIGELGRCPKCGAGLFCAECLTKHECDLPVDIKPRALLITVRVAERHCGNCPCIHDEYDFCVPFREGLEFAGRNELRCEACLKAEKAATEVMPKCVICDMDCDVWRCYVCGKGPLCYDCLIDHEDLGHGEEKLEEEDGDEDHSN